MPLTVTRFGSAIDLKTATFNATQIAAMSAAETDAIVLLDVDVTTASGVTNPSPNVTSVGGNTQATLYMNFTLGSLTNVVIKFYGSYFPNPTATQWFSESDAADSTGTLSLSQLNITLTASTPTVESNAGGYMFHFPIGACRAYKITVTPTGTATGSALSLAVGMRSN
jgi:hypothetical protein